MRAVIVSALCGFLLPVLAIMGYNYWQDPFRFYRFEARSTYSDNARWQNPALLKHTDYDTVLIGTSRFANFQPSMFEPEWKVLKVTADGSMAGEQLATLELALDLGRVRRVVMEASYVSFTGTSSRDPAEFPGFLYATTLETPFSYLLSYDLLKSSLTGVFDRERSLEELYVWSDRMGPFGKDAVLRTVLESCAKDFGATASATTTAAHLRRLDQSLGRHAEVEFLLVIPPMLALTLTGGYRDDVRLEDIQHRLEFRSALMRLASRHDNLKLYDYASVAEIVLDYGLFSDPGHFRPEINRRIARELVSATAPSADLKDINGPLIAVRSQVNQRELPCRRDALAELAGRP